MFLLLTCKNFKHPFLVVVCSFSWEFFSVFINWYYQSSFKAGINSHWETNANFSLDVYFQNLVYLKIIFYWWDICHQTELDRGAKSYSPLSIKGTVGLLVVLSVGSGCLMRQNFWKRLFADQKLWILLRGQLHQQCCEKWTQVNDETQAKMARMAAAAAWGLGNVSSCAGLQQPMGCKHR